MIRVLVAARRPMVRAGLAAVLRPARDLDVVGEAAGAGDLLALAASLAPAVALIELESAGEALAGAAATLATEAPDLAVVVMADADGAWIAGVLHSGIRGVLGRDAESTAIVAAVHAVAQNLLVLPPAMARSVPALETMAHSGDPPLTGATTEGLTPRELEVLRLISEGLGNKGIAQRLKISDHTVKFHVASAMARMGAASRAEAVATAVRRGLILL